MNAMWERAAEGVFFLREGGAFLAIVRRAQGGPPFRYGVWIHDVKVLCDRFGFDAAMEMAADALAHGPAIESPPLSLIRGRDGD